MLNVEAIKHVPCTQLSEVISQPIRIRPSRTGFFVGGFLKVKKHIPTVLYKW